MYILYRIFKNKQITVTLIGNICKARSSRKLSVIETLLNLVAL